MHIYMKVKVSAKYDEINELDIEKRDKSFSSFSARSFECVPRDRIKTAENRDVLRHLSLIGFEPHPAHAFYGDSCPWRRRSTFGQGKRLISSVDTSSSSLIHAQHTRFCFNKGKYIVNFQLPSVFPVWPVGFDSKMNRFCWVILIEKKFEQALADIVKWSLTLQGFNFRRKPEIDKNGLDAFWKWTLQLSNQIKSKLFRSSSSRKSFFE